MNPAASAVAWLPSLPVPGTLFFSSLFVVYPHCFALLCCTSPLPISSLEASPEGCCLLRNQTRQNHDGTRNHNFWRKKVSKVVFCRVRTNRTRGIYPGYLNLTRVFTPVITLQRTSVGSVGHPYPYPELLEVLYGIHTCTRNFWKFCTPVATIPGVRVQNVLYPLGTSVSSVRLCHNTRNFWNFCKTSVRVPGTSVSSVRSSYPYPEIL